MAINKYIYVSSQGFKFWVAMDDSHALLQNGVRADPYLSIIGKWPYTRNMMRRMLIEWEDESRTSIVQLQENVPPIGTKFPLRRKNTLVIGATVVGVVGETYRPLITDPNFT